MLPNGRMQFSILFFTIPSAYTFAIFEIGYIKCIKVARDLDIKLLYVIANKSLSLLFNSIYG